MSNHATNRANGACPYRGLEPYTEKYSNYFVGRERDQQTIAANLFAMPVTVLYGASGVGKSSVLLAGVVPHLKRAAHQAVVVFRHWQGDGFQTVLKNAVLDAVNEVAISETNVDRSLAIDAFLRECSHALGGPIYLIFDQFEEYFLYHAPSKARASFDSEFARIINARELDVNVLLSMRGEELSKLDRFRGRIPNILGNMLRLDHLDRASAERAIVEPLIEYNRDLPTEKHVTIENELVTALLQKSAASHEGLSADGLPTEGEASPAGIETPVLQILLTRLWKEEMAAGSNILRVSTFNEALGGAESIISSYLDEKMEQVSEADREVAASAFRFLVTPSRTKIAQDLSSLAEWTEIEKTRVESVLTKLASQEMMVVRALSFPNQPKRYEIFHDVLASAVRDWRDRFTQTREKAKSDRRAEKQRKRAEEQMGIARRLRWVTAALLVVCFGAFAAAWYAKSKQVQAQRSEGVAKENERKWRDTLSALNQASAEKAVLIAKKETFKQEAAILRADLEADELQTQHVPGALDKFRELLTLYENAKEPLQNDPSATDEEKELLKQYRLGEANTYMNIANIYFENGSNMSTSNAAREKAFRDAITNYEKALTIKREVLGEDHQDVAPVLKALADSYHEVRNDSKATTYINTAIHIYESKGGFSNSRPLSEARKTRDRIQNNTP